MCIRSKLSADMGGSDLRRDLRDGRIADMPIRWAAARKVWRKSTDERKDRGQLRIRDQIPFGIRVVTETPVVQKGGHVFVRRVEI